MKSKGLFIAGVSFLAAFVLWTVLVRTVDVRAIGPSESSVGFAALNEFIHGLTGVNMLLYTVTDWLGLVPICVAFGFAVSGLVQWIGRKSLFKVDRSIIALGMFYVVVIAAYLFFEVVVINYRPVLIDGYLEASYPSSTTMLVMCVMPTAMLQFRDRIKNGTLRRCVMLAIVAFTVFMVVGRFVSGVHWATDIIGGALFSTGIVTIYGWVLNIFKQMPNKGKKIEVGYQKLPRPRKRNRPAKKLKPFSKNLLHISRKRCIMYISQKRNMQKRCESCFPLIGKLTVSRANFAAGQNSLITIRPPQAAEWGLLWSRPII